LADSTKYFFLFGLIIFLGVISYLDIIQFFIGPKYREGLKIVAVYMLGSLGLGVYFNLSFWYKLNGKTYFGLIITAIGALITVVLNIIFIPHFGYVASAWARLICYITIIIISYRLGQKYYPINYPLLTMIKYLVISLVLYFICVKLKFSLIPLDLMKNTLIFALFVWYLDKKEKLVSTFIKRS